MGLYLVWKPKGISSGDALFNFKKELQSGARNRLGFGHTGTLDPFAEGLLLVGTGEGTKLLAPLQGLDKTYRAQMLWGVSSASLDTESALRWSDTFDGQMLSPEKLAAFAATKVGAFSQVPPEFSAVHVDGRRAYEWAREGQPKELKARNAEILKLQSLALRSLEFGGRKVWAWDFEVQVSSGTYIRCLARDWGMEFGAFPGMLKELVRTCIASFEYGYPLEGRESSKCGEKIAYRRIQIDELRSLFDEAALPPGVAERVQKNGVWEPRGPLKRPLLLQNSATGDFIAWVEEKEGRLGRIFLKCPLREEF